MITAPITIAATQTLPATELALEVSGTSEPHSSLPASAQFAAVLLMHTGRDGESDTEKRFVNYLQNVIQTTCKNKLARSRLRRRDRETISIGYL